MEQREMERERERERGVSGIKHYGNRRLTNVLGKQRRCVFVCILFQISPT